MVEKHFEIVLPEEVVAGFGWQDVDVPAKIREALVMELLRRDQISEGQAAELLKLDRWELLEMMGHYRVSAIRMKPEDVQRELARRRRVRRRSRLR